MLVKQDGDFNYGYNSITEESGKHSNMLMDIGILKLKAGETETILQETKEVAALIITGEIIYEWNGNSHEVKRDSCFDEGPTCLHVSKNTEIKITAKAETELVIQKTTNDKEFDAVLHTPEDCVTNIFGEHTMNGVAKRWVRDIFNLDNAPNSNMVMGEVINQAGKWSSFPPHGHPQPEVYFYKFTKPQGFGCSFIGDEAFKVTTNDSSCIPGGPTHPQVAAPGYGMYYCWMIRHLDNDPWAKTRNNDPEHEWLNDENAVIWPDKK